MYTKEQSRESSSALPVSSAGSLTGLQFGGTRGGSGSVGGKKEEEEKLAEEKRKKEEKKQRRKKNRRLWYLETKAEEEFTR